MSAPTPQITLALPEQAAALAQLCSKTFLQAYEGRIAQHSLQRFVQQAFSTERIREELHNESCRFYALWLQGQVMGYLKLDLNLAPEDFPTQKALQLHRIYLRREVWGRGYGDSLMDTAESEAQRIGATLLWLNVWQENPGAIAFYQRRGFSILREIPYTMNDNEVFDDWLMIKRL